VAISQVPTCQYSLSRDVLCRVVTAHEAHPGVILERLQPSSVPPPALSLRSGRLECVCKLAYDAMPAEPERRARRKGPGVAGSAENGRFQTGARCGVERMRNDERAGSGGVGCGGGGAGGEGVGGSGAGGCSFMCRRLSAGSGVCQCREGR
jgi:hypothetical protein